MSEHQNQTQPAERSTFEAGPGSSGPCIHYGEGIGKHWQDIEHEPDAFVCPQSAEQSNLTGEERDAVTMAHIAAGMKDKTALALLPIIDRLDAQLAAATEAKERAELKWGEWMDTAAELDPAADAYHAIRDTLGFPADAEPDEVVEAVGRMKNGSTEAHRRYLDLIDRALDEAGAAPAPDALSPAEVRIRELGERVAKLDRKTAELVALVGNIYQTISGPSSGCGGDELEAAKKFRADYDRMTARLTELEAIVGKLPLTADGVRVTPGMNVWRYDSRTESFRLEPVTRIEADDPVDWSDWYSTPEAARAAAEKGGEK